MAKGPTKSMWMRMLIIMLALSVGTFSVSAVRLTKIMLLDSDFYQQKASEQQLYDTELSPTRGNIYDRNMDMLATSATVWTAYITPNDLKKITDAAERDAVVQLIADNVSRILEMDRDKVVECCNKSSAYVILKKRVEKPQADELRRFIADNKLGYLIGLDESSKRYYPNENLASVLLGFVGDDNQGLSGIEAYYESELKGIPGRVVAAKNARGMDMPFSYEKMVDATPGNSLVLTIDKYIQHVSDKLLEQAVIDNKVAERGVCIIMNVNTGEILAMSIKGDFNPNDPFTLSEEDSKLLEDLTGDERTTKLSELRNKQWRNKAVSDPYEPGSVFKVITLAAALEDGLTSFDSHFNCPGYIVVAGQRYSCHKRIGHGSQNLVEAFQNSCNPVFISLGQLLGVSSFSRYFDAFGLTQKTGIDLPGEAAPMYHKEANMGPTELSSTSFGQTFKITPIQLITAISAAVNGGYLVQPHVVNQIIDGNNNVVKSVDNVRKRQVISTETSMKMRQLMEKVVDGGGGKNAYVPGYRIGGKTGTSQKVDKMLQENQGSLYISSFCGVAPMDDPQIAALILLDEPKGDAYYGGMVAAPVGGQIFKEILPYLGYQPQYTQEELEKMEIKTPDVVGKPVSTAENTIKSLGLNVKIIGDGENIFKQNPAPNQSINRNGIVVLYTDNTKVNTVTVPDLTGLTISGVNTRAAKAGLNIEFAGTSLTDSGVLSYKQSVEEGTTVEVGTTITVYFRSEDTIA